MTHEDFEKAAGHWVKADAQSVKMPKEELWAEIEKYAMENNTCAIATGYGTQIRNTPLEYGWHDKCVWIFSEGGEKFIGLEKNPNVCIAIFNGYTGFGNVKGMQIQGTADIIEPFSPEYIAAIEAKKFSVTAFRKMPEPLNLIKVTPTRINFLNSDFKKMGYGSRQEWKA